MKTKNTRLVYTDEKNLKAYASLPAEDFKEFFMAYLTYQDGDDVGKIISNPFVQTLFMAAYADKIIHNEKKWEDAAEKRRENGKKGGRPKKNNDITPIEEPEISQNKALNSSNDTDVPPRGESVPETKYMAKFEASEDEFNSEQINREENMGNFTGFTVKVKENEQKADKVENDNYSDATYDFLDEYELIVKNCISTLASSDNEIWKKSAKRKLINTLEDAGIENGSREFEEVHKYVQLMVDYKIKLENEYKEILTA